MRPQWSSDQDHFRKFLFPHPNWGSMWTLTGLVVSEEKIFEESKRQRTMDDRALPILYDGPFAQQMS